MRLGRELQALAPLRAKLLAVRDRRQQPRRDDRIVAALNGLTVSADVDKDIGEHMHKVHSLYLSRFPKYEGQMRDGIVAVEGLEASAIRLITDIGAALAPVVRS